MKAKLRTLALVLTALVVSAAVTSVQAGSYLTSDGYYFWLESDEAVAVHGCDSEKTELDFPVMLGNAFITSIDDNAFFRNTQITSVSFARLSRITRIGEGAFYGCGGITEIELPDSLAAVSEGTFQDCTALRSAVLGGGVKRIGAQAFYNCQALQSAVLNEGLESIGNLAFGGCAALKEITIPDSVTKISANAFYNVPELTVYCTSHSYAAEFAEGNGLRRVLTDKLLEGDANLDGNLMIDDATEIQWYLAEKKRLSPTAMLNADITRDGSVSIDDVTKIQRCLAELFD